MIEICLKYDNMHIFGIINAFNCINNHVTNVKIACYQSSCTVTDLLKTKISSKNTITKCRKNLCNILFINDWKVAGAFIRPKGITWNS